MSKVPNTSAIKSSPVRPSAQGSQRFAASQLDASDMKSLLASDLHCHWVGPMPVETFFETFLDIGQEPPSQLGALPNDYFDAMPHTKKEPEMYPPFIELVTNSHIAPTLKLLNTSNHEDPDAEPTMKNRPDITAYDINANVTTTEPLSYAQAEIIFELKPEHKPVDPFEDLTEQGTDADLHKFLWEPTAEGRRKCRGQLACYARAWMSLQHRTHCFVVWIGGSCARIVRFDRTGAIVTESFNIRSQSRLLLEFLWRMSCASRAMRGHDTTVSVVADPVEIELAKEKLAQWAPDPKDSQTILKLDIPDEGSANDSQPRQVLVWAPLANPQCVVGRATRGYPAWDLKDKKLVFVKDSWRVIAENISKETDILKTLKAANVSNVPKYLSGDDLPDQVTKTQDFASAEWNMGGQPETFSKRAHIRFTTNLIGTPLTKFTSSKSFVQAWLHAVLAHQEAYTKCGILHRDISLNNILINADGGGFLNDWDLARTIADIEAGPRQPSRSGTWQFMSMAVLRTPDKKQTVEDDLESFFWVLLYVTLRYLQTSIVESSVASVMHNVFDSTVITGRQVTGGATKEQLVQHRTHIGESFSVRNNNPLTVLIDDILRILKNYHRFWTYFSDDVETLASDKGISLESAEQIHREKAKNLKLSSHTAMVSLGQTALAKDWSSNDRVSDRCTKRSSKRTRANELDDTAQLGSDAQKKRKI